MSAPASTAADTDIPHRRHHRPAAVLAVALAGLATGCFGAGTSAQTLGGAGARAEPQREFVNGAIAATNQLAVDLHKAGAGGPGNVVNAPYGAMTALAMARAGSAGTTRDLFDRLLHADRTPNLDGGLNAADAALRARNGERQSTTRKGRVELERAIALWGQKGLHVKEDLLNLLAADYGEGFHVVDFHAGTDGSREAVNAWAEDGTGGLVSELVDRGGTPAYTRFLATVATGLRAPWLVPFDLDKSRPDRFRRDGEPPVDAQMMEVTSDLLRAATGDGWEAVELPYLGDELALDLVLPTGPLAELESRLDPSLLAEVFDRLDRASRTAVDLRVPRVALTTSLDLRDTLNRLGLVAAFDRTADFSGVTNDEVVSLAKVPYEGVFSIEEDGTNPRPDTASLRNPAPPLITARRVVVDHPFLFVVRDRPTGLVLFLGRVVNPV
jgi:serpin B